MKVSIICDNCLQITIKDSKKLHQHNFCSAKCKNKFNSCLFTNFNQTTNPMNQSVKTIDERAKMRLRMLNRNQEKTQVTKTYNKYLGELKHRRIAKMRIGRELKPNEVVHHKDGNIHNNKPSSLQVMGRTDHTRLHMKLYWQRKYDDKK